MIGRALARTAALWPDVEQAYRFVHAVAHWLGNPQDESAARVRRRVNGVLGAMQRHRDTAGSLAGAIDHFQKVTRSYRSGLFHTYAVPDLPRTNNDLEHLFGSQRYHERRATGRKTASSSAVLRGSVRLIAATPHVRGSPRHGNWERRTGSTGDACANASRKGDRHERCAPAFDMIPSPTLPPSNTRPASQLCRPRKKRRAKPFMRSER